MQKDLKKKQEPHICANCGEVSLPKVTVPGSFIIELLLLILGIIPGLIYNSWRIQNRRLICNKCGSQDIFEINTLKGKKLSKEFYDDQQNTNIYVINKSSELDQKIVEAKQVGEAKKNKNQRIKEVVFSIVGIFLLLSGISSIILWEPRMMPTLMAGLIAFTPSYRYLEKKTGLELTNKMRSLAIFVCFIIPGFLYNI